MKNNLLSAKKNIKFLPIFLFSLFISNAELRSADNSFGCFGINCIESTVQMAGNIGGIVGNAAHQTGMVIKFTAGFPLYLGLSASYLNQLGCQFSNTPNSFTVICNHSKPSDEVHEASIIAIVVGGAAYATGGALQWIGEKLKKYCPSLKLTDTNRQYLEKLFGVISD